MEYRKFLENMKKEELIKHILGYDIRTSVTPTQHKRKIALKFFYDGSRFSGLVSQTRLRTVEDYLKVAITGSGIGDANQPLSFAGRTDKGVSGCGMVVSFVANSRLPIEEQHEIGNEYDYCSILNANLPYDIGIKGWAAVGMDFDARYSCVMRSYKYFFLKQDLDLEQMRRAVCLIQKQTNFMNLSKHLNKNELLLIKDLDKHFYRPVKEIEIIEYDGYCVLYVRSVSFLHHMIRKIFHILEQAGSGKISQEEILALFCSDRVEVGTAKAEPLIFISAEYEKPLVFFGTKSYLRRINDIKVKDYVRSEMRL